ncbi:MAG: 50S ribosomal protein L19 [Phycisphaerae bacterium]|nr:50S ribosomal protein L19 [Phycisphaerae bacterium]
MEGDKERTQIFNGVIIAMNGRGLNRSFTVRRIVANEGVERTFLMHSPFVKKLEVVRSGKVRRAKLFYLRDRVGKSRKLREKRIRHAEHQGDNGAPEGELPRAIPAPARELAAVDT